MHLPLPNINKTGMASILDLNSDIFTSNRVYLVQTYKRSIQFPSTNGKNVYIYYENMQNVHF